MTADASPDRFRTDRKQIGAFFTPLPIAVELIRTYAIHKAWAEGKSVLDPTAGRGNLLEALILCCTEEGIPVTGEMLARLRGIEREEEFTRGFSRRIRESCRIDVPDDILITGDFMEQPSSRFDLLLGNPPWLNFTDLPEEEKEEMKILYRRYGLVDKGMSTLLGGSRIDVAALIIQKALQDHLHPDGRGYFFIPLSLLLNEGAHNRFRRGRLDDGFFSISEIRDFGENRIFEDVSTRCGFAVFAKSERQKREIPYFSLTTGGEWREQRAGTAGYPGSSYRILDGTDAPDRIRLKASSRPRQGINTGGRNSLFIFDSAEPDGEGAMVLKNRTGTARLPADLIYPLISSRQFKGSESPEKFIFLPYSIRGGVLDEAEIAGYPDALNYLGEHRESLIRRKGSLLGNTMKKGRFWTLLGVGPYTFAPWKIVWEAYGKKEFNPRLFHTWQGRPWIPNQALQASCAFEEREEAERVLRQLQNPLIGRILSLHNMEGTCSWAQPGRIARFMEFEQDQ